MKKILTFLAGLSLYANLMAVPQIYPTILEVDLKGPTTYSEVTISNIEENPKKYEISLKQADSDFDLTPYVTFFPEVMDLEPGVQKNIRIAIQDLPFDKLEDGELRTLLEVKEISSNLHTKYRSKYESEGIKTNIAMVYNVAMMVYARKGRLEAEIEVKDVEVREGEVQFTINNLGNYSYSPVVTLYEDGKATNIKVPKLLRGGERTVRDDYAGGVLELLVEDSSKNILFKERLN